MENFATIFKKKNLGYNKRKITTNNSALTIKSLNIKIETVSSLTTSKKKASQRLLQKSNNN